MIIIIIENNSMSTVGKDFSFLFNEQVLCSGKECFMFSTAYATTLKLIFYENVKCNEKLSGYFPIKNRSSPTLTFSIEQSIRRQKYTFRPNGLTGISISSFSFPNVEVTYNICFSPKTRIHRLVVIIYL